MTSPLIELKIEQRRIFTRASKMLSPLTSPVRLQILHFLSQAPQSVEVLSHKLEQSMANTSMHLRKLHQDNIVKVENQGQKRIYSLAHPILYDFWEEIQDFFQIMDPNLKLNVEDVYGDIAWGRDRRETKNLLRNNQLIFLDVRPKDEVLPEINHDSPGYLHIPSQELKNHVAKLPKRKSILVICRGRLCALSAFAVNLLRENKLKAYRINQSWHVINKLYFQGELK